MAVVVPKMECEVTLEEKKLTKRERILMAGTAVVVGAISWKLGGKYTAHCISLGMTKVCEATPGLYDAMVDGMSNYMKSLNKKD